MIAPFSTRQFPGALGSVFQPARLLPLKSGTKPSPSSTSDGLADGSLGDGAASIRGGSPPSGSVATEVGSVSVFAADWSLIALNSITKCSVELGGIPGWRRAP